MGHSDSNSIYMIFTIATILFTSPYIASFVKFPTAPIEIVLGAIAGYFSFLKPENEIFTLMAEVGFLSYVFSRNRSKLKSSFKA